MYGRLLSPTLNFDIILLSITPRINLYGGENKPMVLSNEEILKQKNLPDFTNTTPDVVDMLRRERLNPLRIIEEAEKFKNDKFYDKESFEAKYGFKKRDYDVLISINHHNLVYENKEHNNKICDLFYEQLYKHGGKLLKDLEKAIPPSNIVSSPETALTEAKYMLMVNSGDKDAILKKYFDLEFDMAKDASDYYRENNGLVLFDQYKKDVLDKLPSTSEKLDALAKFLYVQEYITEGHIEKKAVDFYLEKTGFLEAVNMNFTDKELEIAGKDAEKWCSKHNNPVNFLDLARVSSSKPYFKLLYKIAKILGFRYYNYRHNKELDEFKPESLRYIFALLNKNPELYKNNKELKEFTLYLCYMLWPVIQHGRSYTMTALGADLMYEKALSDKDKEIEDLKRELKIISVLEDKLEAKQETLNKLQLEYDRLKNKELAKLKEELEEKTRLLKELNEKNSFLEEINLVLDSQIEEMEAAAEDISSDTSNNRPTKYIENRLKELNVVIMGGHQIWQSRVKEIYPYFTYVDSDNVNFDINITRNADIIFFNTLHCSHTLFYRIKNNVNNGRSNNKEKLVYVGSNNLSYFKEVVSNIVLEAKK